MTSDEARERFDAAFEGELELPDQQAFDAALRDDEALREEWEEYVATLRAVRGLELDQVATAEGVEDAAARASAEKLVEGVQHKLRVRSRGRFYRDRFASVPRGERLLPVLLAIVALVLLVAAWAGQRVIGVGPIAP